MAEPAYTAPLRYPGAKWSAARWIIENLPDHYHYIEPFFGSGAVFFTKDASPHEVINDQDGRVVNLFRVMRDHTDDLLWRLEMTPWARTEYDLSDEPTDDPIEAARRFVVRCWQAHASDLAKRTGWKSRGAVQYARGMSDRWSRVPAQLLVLVPRLREAEIESRDALEVIQRHNTDSALIYADPPYPAEVRTQKMYALEMTDAQHMDLLDVLVAHHGPVVLSGYANTLYDERLRDWRRLTRQAAKVHGSARTECLWIKGVPTRLPGFE